VAHTLALHAPQDEGMDDLIDDAGEDMPSAAELIKMRRQVREAELAAARDNEPNPEELDKFIKERYGNRR
jgi:hypothetical protein